jgi:hypothetical protein
MGHFPYKDNLNGTNIISNAKIHSQKLDTFSTVINLKVLIPQTHIQTIIHSQLSHLFVLNKKTFSIKE